MSKEPKHKHFGYSISEWISRVPNELPFDAVGLWQLVSVGRDSFDLSGDELYNFVQKGIIALLSAGAVPVRSSSMPDVLWEEQFNYGSDVENIAINVIDEWMRSGVDPDHDGLWFSAHFK